MNDAYAIWKNVELKTTKNISIDGISGQNSKTLMDYRQLFNWTKEEDPGNPGTLIDVKGKFKPQLVSYKLNDEGRLTKLDTVELTREQLMEKISCIKVARGNNFIVEYL